MTSYWCLIVAYVLTGFLYEISAFKISVTLNLTFQGPSRSNVMVRLASLPDMT